MGRLIIGTKNVDINKVNNIILTNMDGLVEYVESLVPSVLATREIKDNQRYYVALLLRKNPHISYELKVQACKKLIEGIYINGNQDTIITVEDLIAESDFKRLLKYLFRKELRESK